MVTESFVEMGFADEAAGEAAGEADDAAGAAGEADEAAGEPEDDVVDVPQAKSDSANVQQIRIAMTVFNDFFISFSPSLISHIDQI
jgi:hypothetical protein